MALFGTLASLRAQAPQHAGFAVAFDYVTELLQPGSTAHTRLRGIARGASQKIELSGGVFAVEQVYDTKPRAEGFFESHRKYIDVQIVAEGEELMEVVDVSRITVREPYVAERDLITYHDTDKAAALRLVAGEGAIFFPVDIHMPSLRLGSTAVLVRKSVVKVPVA
jgi:biofilm protein TabA